MKAFAGFEQNGAKGDLISNEKPFVCPTNNGHFGDPNDCTKFYKCAHGTPIAEFCPATLFWNQGMFFHIFVSFFFFAKFVLGTYTMATLFHFVAIFHVASLLSTGLDNKKVGVDNEKALELTNSTVFHRDRQ